MGERLDRVHVEIAEALSQLETLFSPDMELTFLARCKTSPDRHVLVTKSSLAEIREAIDALARATEN